MKEKREKPVVAKANLSFWFKSKYLAIIDYFAGFKTKNGWKKLGKTTGKQLNANKLLIAVAFFCIIIGSMNSNFWSPTNWQNIFKQNANLGVLAVGMCFVILTGGIDLSVGSVVALTGASVINFINKGMNGNIAILCVVLIGLVIGFLQGFFVSVLKLQAFIVTLAGMMLFRGLTYVVTHNMGVTAPDDKVLTYWANTKWAGMNMQIWVLIILVLASFFILRFTIYGRNLYATGSNENAARLSGVRTKSIICSTYSISGVLAALAGAMTVAMTKSANPGNTGNGFELQAVAAVVLGGTALIGGRGGVVRSFIGFMVLAVIKNALFAIGYDMNTQQVFSGAIVLLAVAFERNYGVIDNFKMVFNKWFRKNKVSKQNKTE